MSSKNSRYSFFSVAVRLTILFCLVVLAGQTHYALGTLVALLSFIAWVVRPVKKKVLSVPKVGLYAHRVAKYLALAFLIGAANNFAVKQEEAQMQALDNTVEILIQEANNLITQNNTTDAYLKLKSAPPYVNDSSKYAEYNSLLTALSTLKSDVAIAELAQSLNKKQFDRLIAKKYVGRHSKNQDLNKLIIAKMEKIAPSLKEAYYSDLKQREADERKRVASVKKEQRKIAAIEKKYKERIKKFGEPPKQSGWDGSYQAVKKYLDVAANDPDSIEFEGCTEVQVDDSKGWLVGCDYRGKNAFGGKVKNSNWFLIKHGVVVSVLPAGAYR